MAKTQKFEDSAEAPPSDDHAPATRGPLGTPSEWRAANFPAAPSGRPHPERWRHAAADALHGWTYHEHHYAGEVKISEADYKAALQAASAPRGQGNHYEPHAAACSPAKMRR
jgi:hypothetical protein